MKKLIPESIKRLFRILKFKFIALTNEVDISEMKFIGVTGTSGKTTTSSLIYHLLNENKIKVGLISTVGVIMGNEKMDTGFHVTSPDPEDLIRAIKKMKSKGIEYIVLESSSHALAQGRLGNIKYDYAIFTNIKHDHLDWHKTWENYAGAKARLIDMLQDNKVVVINKDDKRSYDFLKEYVDKTAEQKKVTLLNYSLKDTSNVTESLEGIIFDYKNQHFKLKMLGEYNLSNALAAIQVAESFNISLENISNALATFKTVQGRMEVLQTKPFTVILDFAHNEDSLRKSLQTARKFTQGKLISVFGSAGLRDFAKRFDMGQVSGELADITIVTAEDPRIEKLFDINSEIIRGLKSTGAQIVKRFQTHKDYLSYMKENKTDIDQEQVRKVYSFDEEDVQSRYDAIQFAVNIAQPGDLIITNGKGHEQSLCFGNIEYPYSDEDAIKKALGNDK
jgi:UDP-N-acetylmuramoyl-L-alanyl-D-glutamate--2,6-diaminopimelate ligase